MYELTDTRHGRFLVNQNDTYVGRSLREYGEWSEAEVFLFSQIVRKGDYVVEAGANIGSHTVFLSKQVGFQGKILAFEPQRLTHQLLCANLALNECFNVDARRAAVGAVNGVIQVPDIEPSNVINYGAVSLLSHLNGAEHKDVPLFALDDFHFDRLDFIKADIEGFEPAMLKGAQHTIDSCRPVIYMEMSINKPPRGNVDELQAALQAHRYLCYYYITPLDSTNNFRGSAAVIFNQVSLDMICVPQEKWQVHGLTPIYSHDQAIEYREGGAAVRVLPWNGARMIRL
jgi:FkbM family methyltransferase